MPHGGGIGILPPVVAKVRKSNPSAGAKPAAKPAAARRPASPRPATAPGASGLMPELLRMAALVIICMGIWCTIYDRWSGENWSVPLEYGLNPAAADVKTELAGFKAAEEGHYFPGIFHYEPNLNAPYGANWNDVPGNEDFIWWGTGVLARAIGLFPAVNLLVLALQVLAALAFYYAARRLKCEWKWSFGGALLFALAPYAFAHSLHHVDIVAYWNVPLDLMVCYWIASGLRLGTRDYWLALGVAVVTGFLNVYYINIFIQLVGISLIIRWMRHGWRDWRVCLPPLSIGAAAVRGVYSHGAARSALCDAARA